MTYTTSGIVTPVSAMLVLKTILRTPWQAHSPLGFNHPHPIQPPSYFLVTTTTKTTTTTTTTTTAATAATATATAAAATTATATATATTTTIISCQQGVIHWHLPGSMH
eukprot:4541707-Amphidinium_carterae.1